MAETRSASGAEAKRPLSPHIQVYKPLVNMVMSILHRITGAALYFGSLLLIWWLVAAAVGPAYFDYVNSWFANPFGKLVLFGYTFALIHHAVGGIRHFIWDSIHGFDLKTVDVLSWGSIVVSTLLTAGIWAYVIAQRGGL